jgi:hypothetical protein
MLPKDLPQPFIIKSRTIKLIKGHGPDLSWNADKRQLLDKHRLLSLYIDSPSLSGAIQSTLKNADSIVIPLKRRQTVRKISIAITNKKLFPLHPVVGLLHISHTSSYEFARFISLHSKVYFFQFVASHCSNNFRSKR